MFDTRTAGVTLTDDNQLVRQPSGVWLKTGHRSIAYSDGAESERFLAEVLSSAADLSSTSPELDRHIGDWPSEYHLSSRRANLFRALHMAPGRRILELGSGCGAISRYLGEQGHAVDAVEGSLARAELGAMRCRGLDNVRVICANFNDLELPRNHYDVVTAVGVLEYARRFRPDSGRDDPVVELTRALRQALRDDGLIAVAIENRTGLKYVLGAHEDHYGRRYVGVNDYRNDAGMRTYTMGEWEAIAARAGIGAARFLLPFPDYKVPTVILSGDYANGSRFAFSHLEGLSSRDYTVPLRLGVHEPMFWQSAAANGTLASFANSFLILLAGEARALDEAAPFDFAHLPDFKRKRGYCAIVTKPRHSDRVVRRRLDGVDAPPPGRVEQTVSSDRYLLGNLLAVVWSRSLAIDPWGREFGELLKTYYGFLDGKTLNIDLVPNNMIVAEDGSYEAFDREWTVHFDISREYVFFRALMLFAIRYARVITEFARRHGLHTVRDFVLYGFREIGTDAVGLIDGFCRKEYHFQIEVNQDAPEVDAQTFLASSLSEPEPEPPVCAKLYWKGPGQEYSEDHCLAVDAFATGETVALRFELPPEAAGLTHVRFDPCDESRSEDLGFLTIAYLRVSSSVDGVRRNLVELEGCEQVAAAGRLSGMFFNRARYGEVFAVLGDNPELEVPLGGASDGGAVSAYRVEVRCSHIRSGSYRLVRDGYLAREEALRNELADAKRLNERLTRELREIKRSRLWKAGERYRSWRNRGGN